MTSHRHFLSGSSTIASVIAALCSASIAVGGGSGGSEVPTGLQASDGTSTAFVALTWTIVGGATGYEVLRDGGAAPIGSTDQTSYFDATATPGVQYSYRVRAVFGGARSAPSSPNTGFRQLQSPAALSASDGTSSANVAVAWSAVEGATGYRVFRAVGTAAPTQLATTAAPSFLDTTAVPGTAYVYSTRATGPASGSVSAPSNLDEGFRQLAQPVLTASDGTSTSGVVITWPAVAGATRYDLSRDGVALAAPTANSFTDTSAVPGVQYSYSANAVSASVVGPVGLPNLGFRQLTPPTGVTASDGTFSTLVRVTWSPAVGATGYQVFRSGTALPIGTTPGTSFDDTAATPGAAFTYTVRATGPAPGSLSAPSAGEAGHRGIEAPANMAATDGIFTANVRVTWSLVPGATGYRVFRAVGASTPTQIAQVSSTTAAYADSTAVPGLEYVYTVRGVSSVGLGAPSQDAGYRQLLAPTGVTATDGTLTTHVQVTWAPVVGAAAYQVFRQDSTGIPVFAGFTIAPIVTLRDNGAIPGVPLNYSVRAVSAVALSAASALEPGWRQVSAPTNLNASDGTNELAVELTWSPSFGATDYFVFRSGSTQAIAVVPGTATAYSDTAAAMGTRYSYSIRAAGPGPGALSALSGANTGWRNRAGPTVVTATEGTRDGGVLVSWDVVTGTPTVTGYLVTRTWICNSSQTIDGREVPCPPVPYPDDCLDPAVTTITVPATSLTCLDATARPGRVYEYSVQARFTIAGSTPQQTAFSLRSAPSGPGWRNLPGPPGVAAGNDNPARIRVTWQRPTVPVLPPCVPPLPPITGYRLLRSQAGDPPVVIATINNPATLFHNDTTAVPGVEYTYVVRSRFNLLNLEPVQTVFSLDSAPATGVRPLPFDGGSDGGDSGGGGAFASMAAGGSRGDTHAWRDSHGGEGVPVHSGAVDEIVPESGPQAPRPGGDAPTDGPPKIGEEELASRLKLRIAGLESAGVKAALELADRLRALGPTVEPVTGEPAFPALRMLEGDVNLDRVVDALDFDAFMDAFVAGDEEVGDLDRDGDIDRDDRSRAMIGLLRSQVRTAPGTSGEARTGAAEH